MIAFMGHTKLGDDGWVDFGPENPRSVRRAARLLRKGVIHALTLERPVTAAWWSADAPLSFGDLVNAGLMVRGVEQAGDFLDPDGFAVRYTVTDRVSFVDNYGKRWVFTTSELWEK